jgi:hypothetical protein
MRTPMLQTSFVADDVSLSRLRQGLTLGGDLADLTG